VESTFKENDGRKDSKSFTHSGCKRLRGYERRLQQSFVLAHKYPSIEKSIYEIRIPLGDSQSSERRRMIDWARKLSLWSTAESSKETIHPIYLENRGP
jgi:hypothetical protein